MNQGATSAVINDFVHALGRQFGLAVGQAIVEVLRGQPGASPLAGLAAQAVSTPAVAAAPVVEALTASAAEVPSPRKGRGRPKSVVNKAPVAAEEAPVAAPKVRRPRRARGCPVAGCNQPSKGPRFSFLCAEHRNMPAAERQKYRVAPRRTGKSEG